ncbi:hypothetical protein ACHAXH_005656 [Discostella pseudostelligera]
MDSMA